MIDWKDVTKELPKQDTTVFGYSKNGSVGVLFYHQDKFFLREKIQIDNCEGNSWISCNIDDYIEDVTHWVYPGKPE